MSETQSNPTHVRGTEGALHPITGEPPGIKEILERRANGGLPETPPVTEETPAPTTTDTTVVQRPDDDEAARAAREVAGLRLRASDADARAMAAEQARQEADRRRVEAENDRAAAVAGAADTGLTAINTALTSATREQEALRAEIKTAGESGDFGRVGELSARIGELGSEIRDLTRGKQELEQDRQTRITNPPPRQEPTPAAPMVTGDPTERGILAGLRAPSREAFLASRTPQTRDFLYQHPEFFTDPSAHARMMGAESLARGQGKVVDSPEYFDAIREASSMTQPTRPVPQRNVPVDRPVPPAAAPSRTVVSPTGRRESGAGEVYVSAEDAKLAEWMQVDPVEYVRERDNLTRRGDLPYRRR